MTQSILHCQGLSMTYTEGPEDVDVLRGINLDIAVGERVAIVGASGSGKSTLLHLLGGLELPSAGGVWIDGKDISQLSDAKRGLLRNRYLGFVYQFHHLLAEFTAVENVAMPLLIAGKSLTEAQTKARELLALIGLEHRLEHRPVELSGGERQRCAIARAMVTEPAMVLADEPTGNLDQATANTVFDVMLALNQRVGTSLLVVTHDQNLARRMDRVLTLTNGELVEA